LRLFLGLISFFILPGAFVSFYDSLRLLSENSGIFLPFAAGTIVSLIVYFLLLSKWHWLSTFVHELSHAIVAFLFFRKITSFVVKGANGGHIRYTSGFGGITADLFIGLAPYYMPVFFILSVLLRPVVPLNWFPYYDAGCGFLFMYHFAVNISETKHNWTKQTFYSTWGSYTKSDIGRVGYLFSGVFIPAFFLFVYAVMIRILAGGYNGVTDVFNTVYHYGYLLAVVLYQKFSGAIQYLLYRVI